MVEFNKKVQEQFELMQKTGQLFRVEMKGQQIWDLYLNSFKPENNPIFRDPTSSSKNCNHCKNFFRRYSNIVAISSTGEIMTLFDFEIEGDYSTIPGVLSKAIRKSPIENVFFETFQELNSLPYEKCSSNSKVFQLGVDKNLKQYNKAEAEMYGVVKEGEIRTFNHLHLKLDAKFVDKTGKSVESIMGNFRDSKNVFKRALDEIPLATLELVRDLINQGSLLDGNTHLIKVDTMIPIKKKYDNLPIEKRDSWCWEVSISIPFARFKNELIGELCTELAEEGSDLNKACQNWNQRVDPANYMKAVAPITQKQKDEAQKFVVENGYMESFDRRFATIDDIKVTEIKHINSGSGLPKAATMFDSVKPTKSQHKKAKFDGIEEVHIDKFMKDILPSCTSVSAMLLNNHDGNMVTLTTSNVEESKPIFKWSNNYSWTFNGNLAGKSQIKESVKTHGGKVDGILRFSIGWAEGDPSDNSDLDAHAQEPRGEHIHFANYRGESNRSAMSGNLDVDITNPASQCHHKNVVENITWSDIRKMKDGVYKLWVNNFTDRGNKGFKAEVEFNGEIFTYEYNQKVKGNVPVAEVTLNKGEFTIKHLLPEIHSSKEIYGLETNEFHKVNLVCLSPNHWNGESVGNKHYFFMLENCKTPNPIRSFHAENLIPELAAHRKVLEILGNTTMLEPADKQLSGLGFNSTVRDELIVKVEGTFKRTLKIKF